MAQARPLFLGAALIALALPGHPIAPMSGLPLDLPALAVLLLLGAWAVALPGAPPRAGLLAAVLCVLAVLKATVGWLAPAYGLDASYRIHSPSAVSVDTAPGTVRVDGVLDFQGDTFPVHFFNDVRYLNFYTPTQPKRDLLPFTAHWSGLLVVPQAGERTLTLEANGPATLVIGDGQRVAVEQPGRVRDESLTANLSAGLTPIVVTYARPDESMPWLVVRDGAAGAEAAPLGGRQVVRPGTSPAAVARDAWLLPLALAIDGLILAVLAVGLVIHTWGIARGWGRPLPLVLSPPAPRSPSPPAPLPQGERGGYVSPSPTVGRGGGGVRVLSPSLSERVLLATYLLAAVGAELLGHLHLGGRAVVLSGGNDWLAYESFARDVLTNGPLLTEGRALGNGLPFYYQPLYIYWLVLSHLLLGESLFAPLFMNAVLGVGAGCGLYLLTRELFGRTAAVVVLPLFETYRQTVFAPTAGLLLSENLLFPLVPVFLLLLARLVTSGRLSLAAGAGLVLGLAGLARTTPLALLPPAVLVLAFAWWRLGMRSRRIAVRLLLLVLACSLTVGLATLRNYVVSGRPVPITSSAGANLWEAHRPSSNVDLSRIDRDPLYERLGLDRQTREVVEFARQDPAGYVGTLAPMFLFAVGVRGAVAGSWDVEPLLVGMWLLYLGTLTLVPRARSLPTWFLHAFVLSHLAQMTVFFSHQYGYRLILPMYVAMAPIAAGGLAALLVRSGRVLAPLSHRRPASAPLPPAARLSLVAVAVVVTGTGLGAAGWRGPDVAREAFYGLNGDAALAVRQAARPDLLRRVDAAYFVGDDSRSTDVAYLSGLAFPTLRWFDGARGLVLPPAGERALYVAPDRAAADVAKRCLGEGASIGRERDVRTGAGLELFEAAAGAGDCAAPRESIGAPFAEGTEATARLVGLEAPASIEPGRTMDVMIHWEALGRPRNRARPFVRLVDDRGRRWGQSKTAVYPSSSWRPGERAVGLARLEVDPTLPPGTYRLQGGFSVGSGLARLMTDGDWGSIGLAQALGPTVRLVSRSTPLTPNSLAVDRTIDVTLGGARLIGVDFDRESLLAGERVRVALFWQAAGGRSGQAPVSLVLRRPGGDVLHRWREPPGDSGYPMSEWKPGEIVRDTRDLVVPAMLAAGRYEVAVGPAGRGDDASSLVSLGTLSVEEADLQLTLPDLRARIDAGFANGARLVGVDYRGRRARAGDTVDLTLIWQAGTPSIAGDAVVTVALLDEAGRVVVQQESEPAGGKRPTSGWVADEYVEDGWKIRLPRDLPRGRFRLAVSMVDPVQNLRWAAGDGQTWAELPIEVGSE